jgi:hypothetical protein
VIKELEEHVTGVVCLRCGILTPLQVSAHWGASAAADKTFHSALTIVRCRTCGKEASYLAHEVVAFKTMTNTLHAAA